MNPDEKPLFQLNGVELSTPPLGAKARREVGFLLGRLQDGDTLGMPHARALPGIVPGLHELRVREADKNWRIFYRVDEDYIVVVHQLNKTTRTLPNRDATILRNRLAAYDSAKAEKRKSL